MSATAAALVPERPTLPKLREAAAGCQACELWRTGTQTVFGEGPRRARLLLVGEQPGDREDREGHPFVGPAGRLLDEALEEAGIARADVYLTNIVKHFRWKAQAGKGGKRIHAKPNAEHVEACRPWLEAELAVVRPELVVPLGATAAQGLLGRSFRVTRERGQVHERDGVRYVATVHPSSILRAGERRAAQRADFVDDLRRVRALLA
ncbi:MAG TPA: UdgX family uracil-DNA binding protein [Egibacteraceae bacterium]|nr:UdgX family uracil-DNA binding protein [Egibacteraceae bacterium]